MLLLGLLPVVVFAQAPQEVVRLLRLVDAETNSSPKTTEDLFDKGIAEVQDAAVLIGTRNRRTNVSSFCGELASYHMTEFKEEKRDAFIYKPHTAINGATGLMTLAIPYMWLRDSSETFPQRVELPLFVCLGDHHHLKITSLKLKKDLLVKKEGYLLYIHKFPAGTGLQIRSAALILDQKWNNAFLLPRNSFTALVVQTIDVKQRQSFSRVCDVTKGLNQECCRWPFYQTQKNGRRVKFHRCVGEATSEDIRFPPNTEMNALLQRGGMTRFINPPSRVCRESLFKPVKVFPKYDHMEVGEMLIKKLHRLDAVECALYY